jgi:transposase
MATTCLVTLGVDTHKDLHVAVTLDQVGRRLGVATFPTDDAHHGRLWDWASGFGPLTQAGVEGTGSFGYRLAQFLTGSGVTVFEVNRPNRVARRRRGKSDPVDAEAAARAVLAGDATATPKRRTGPAGQLRALLVARRSAIKARTQTEQQLRSLILELPDPSASGSTAGASSSSPMPAPPWPAPTAPASPWLPWPVAGGTWTPRSATTTSTST